MKMTRRLLAIVMAVVTIVSVMGIAVEAASVSLANLNLGYMAPTNFNGTKLLNTVTLYSDYDYINFYIDSKKNDSYFFYEIYLDKDYTKLADSGVVECDKGSYGFSQMIKLKGVYRTGKYYLVTYAAKIYSDGSAKIDKTSMREFKFNVSRTAKFNNKIVVLNSIKTNANGVYIKWNKLPDATKYLIYRRSVTATKWTRVGTVSSKYNSFTDKSVKTKDGNYIYTVKAANKNGTYSRYLYSGLTVLYAEAPVISSIAVIGNNTIQVKWNKTDAKAKYDVYRKTNGGSWQKIRSDFTGTTFKDTTAKNGCKYTYTVRAVISTSYGKATSYYYQNADKTITYLQAPYIESVSAVENGVNVKWGFVDGASSYSVYRKPFDGSASWTMIKKVASNVNEYVDTTASITDGAYIYTVRANAPTNQGSYDSLGKVYLILQNPELEVRKRNGRYHLHWENVPNADDYYLYSREPGGEWQKNEMASAGFPDEFNLYYFFTEPGVEREFAVAAVYHHHSRVFNGSQKIYSDFSKNSVNLIYYPNLVPEYDLHKDKIRLYWKDLGADGYNVYKKEALDENAEPQLIASLSAGELEYSDTSVEVGKQYTYIIKGVYKGVEQPEGFNPFNVTVYPKESITEKVNLYYSVGLDHGRNGLKFDGDLDNAIFYIYNDKTQLWDKIFLHSYNEKDGKLIHYYSGFSFNEDGKVKVGVSFKRDDGRTAIEDYVLELEQYQPETIVSQACTKNGVKVTLKPDAQAVSYIIDATHSMDEEFNFTVEEGKNISCTFKEEEFISYGTGISCGAIEVISQRVDGSSVGENYHIYFVATPRLIDAKRNSSGYPVVKWQTTDINENGTLHIYRKAPDGDWECIKTVATNSLSEKKFSGYSQSCYYFVDGTAQSGVNYIYTVQQEVDVRDVPTKSYLNKTGVTTN